MNLHAVVNRKAGGALGADASSMEDQIRLAFGPFGYAVAVKMAEPKDMNAAMDAAVAQKPDVLLVGGGDGSIQCAASKVIGTSIALAILPLGTVNRLARDLGVPLTIPEALQALASGSKRVIDVAEVNAQIFLCNSFIGLPPMIVEERQKLRGRSLLYRSAGYVRLLRMIVASHKKIEVTVNDESGRRVMRVLSLAVSNNPYSEAPSLVLSRPSLDSGKLGLYISEHNGGLSLLWLLAKAAAGHWQGDPKFERFSAKRITITTPRGSVRVVNDGEVERLKTPLNYSIRPKALQILAPVKP